MATTAQAEAASLDREYETIYVLRPDIDRSGAEQVSARVNDVIGRVGGKLLRIESWGKRRLAYPVQKHTRGVYVYFKFVGRGGLVQELERNLRMQDSVLKYQTVKLADDVRVDSYEVKSEEVAYQHVEATDEDEPEETRARTLGLEEAGPERSNEPSRADDSDEGGSERPEAREKESSDTDDEARADDQGETKEESK